MRATVFVGVALLLALTAGCERNPDYNPGSYRAREDGIALRDGGPSCAPSPGPAGCPDVRYSLREGQRVYPLCQRQGQLVGRNAWWVYADGPRGTRGWISSWYLDHPTNRLPGVPTCTAEHLRPRS